MNNENGLYLGIDTKASTPVFFDAYYNKNQNSMIMGSPGTGMGFWNKMRIFDIVQVQDIVNNHLNNNNWLKQHGKPMIRRGHPHYDECKKYKRVKPFEIVVIDTETEYGNMSKILSSEVLKFEKGE